jgi:hypothetical protein
MNKTLCILALTLSLVVLIAPTFAETPVKGGTLTVCQPAEPPGLDPTANIGRRPSLHVQLKERGAFP